MIASLINWLREEWRLMRLQSWENEDMAYTPCSSDDPACVKLIERQAEVRERMKRMKSGLLDASPTERPYTRGADVKATFNRVRSVNYGPVRMVRRNAK